jgi:hypothetical protein
MSNTKPSPTIALGALLLLVVTCMLAIAATLAMAGRAVHELADERTLLSNLEHRARGGGEVASAATAPTSAFVEAPTQGLAGAQLQGYLAQLVAAQHGTLISAGAQPPGRDSDGAEAIRVLATLDVSSGSLQALLYRLETGVPYVFVDALTVQAAPGALGQRGDDPALRVTLSARALWRRPQA